MFYDYAKVHVKGGDGGNGIVAWRREKYVPSNCLSTRCLQADTFACRDRRTTRGVLSVAEDFCSARA